MQRLREVFETMKGFGRHLQFSVFQCDLTSSRLAELKARMIEIIDPEFDQLLLFDLGPSEGRGREVVSSIGKPYREATEQTIVV